MATITRRSVLASAGRGAVALGCAPLVLAASAPASTRRRRRTRPSAAFAREYGIELPFVAAGMAFVGGPPLAAAVSNAGGLGVLGASPEPPPRLQQMIRATRRLTSRPFAVNLINAKGMPGGATPFTTDLHLDVCVAERVPVVSLHWDLPPAHWVKRLHRAGTKVWMQAGSVADALAAVELGIDLVIAQGTNAGGHSKASLPLTQLLPQIVDAARDVPVLAAGGIATGRDATNAFEQGAQGVVVGTRLVASKEAAAHPSYKQRILASDGTDTVKTTMFGPEWPSASLRVLRNHVVNDWAGREHDIPFPPPPPLVIGTTQFAGLPYTMPKFSAVLPTTETSGDFEEMALAAGDGAGRVAAIQPVAEIVREIMR